MNVQCAERPAVRASCVRRLEYHTHPRTNAGEIAWKSLAEQSAHLNLGLEMEAESNLPSVSDSAQSRDVGQPKPHGTSDVFVRIEQRIVEATPGKALELLQIRDEIRRQNELVEDRKHVRTMERWAVGGKLGLSALAIVFGAGLAVAGSTGASYLCLGAELYGLAPSFIEKIVKRLPKW